MDALVDALSKSWHTGTKTLVFVRRVASVKELKRKLDEQYDKWLLDRLHRELPEQVQPRLARVEAQYREERQQAAASRAAASTPRADGSGDADRDQGGTDTFFAWFFRGEGPRGIVSGANIQQRFIQRGATYATFFEDNYVAEILGCEPGVVERHLASALGVDQTTLRAGLRERSARFLSRVQKHARADRFEAVQAAAIQWLKDHSGPHQDAARIVWHQRFESSLRMASAPTAPEIGDWLELRTFFTELRLRPELRQRLWPRPTEADPLRDFREKELRGQLLAAAARLGHAFIDLYIMTIQRLGSLDLRAQEQSDVDRGDAEVDRIGEYLDLLERQMRTPRLERGWGAFDELGELAENFNLVLDVNAPDARLQPLSETARLFGQMLRQQQPIGGMSGQVNQTLVRQFRLPGYPLVLISTDLLQEGEDLHTFCSSVHHYGISWTPSAMEQRIGRIDRVRSQTDRRLSNLAGELREEDKLQVYFPHLEDTVEVLQVQRVLERMNIFLRLMHEGLTTAATESGKIQADHEFAGARRVVPQIRERLRSAFPVRDEQLQGGVAALALTQETAQLIRTRFLQIPRQELPGLSIDWEEATTTEGVLLGTARLGHRVQPFQLRLQTLGNRLLIRCVSPVGCVDPTQVQEQLVASASRRSIRIGVAPARQETTYDVAVVDDVLLADDVAQQDVVRVAMLIRRVVERADLLEQEYLPGNDADLGVFRKDLKEEIQDES
jgi:hypothetical protein